MSQEDREHLSGSNPMKRRDFLRKAAGGTAGVGVLAACGEGAGASASTAEAAVQGPEVNWRLASSFTPSLDILHGTAVRLAERVEVLTGGRFRIRVYAAGEIVPALEVMDAVEQGTVQAGFTPGYYYIGKTPALAFDTSVPFGLCPRQQYAWLHHGGGLEALRSVYEGFGIVNFPAGCTGLQMGGWFRRPVNSLADLRGLRMRIPGMGGEIMARLGVSVQVLGAPDIYPALERGAIDAVEWVGPYDDEKLGFHQIAQNYYMPGWWEPGPTVSLLMGRRAWDALPAGYQEVLASVSKEMALDELARYDAANPTALQRLVNDHGVSLHSFSDEIMEAAWRESNAYLEEMAARDATFRQVYDSFRTFRSQVFPYFAGNELSYARFAFPRLNGQAQVTQ